MSNPSIPLRLSAVCRYLAHIPPALPILLIAIAVRVGYMPGFGQSDLDIFGRWVGTLQHTGLLSFYAQPDSSRPYPPIAMALFGVAALLEPWLGPGSFMRRDPLFLASLKVMPVMFDIALIGVACYWLRRRPILRWLIPAILAVYPGVVILSAWWGQDDSQYILLVALCLMALSLDHPVRAWLLFGLAVLTKQQSAVLTPILLIITYRRYGIRTLLTGSIIAGAVTLVVMTPFFIGSGIGNTLKPYLSATDTYPVLTMNSLNLWYVGSPHRLAVLPWPTEAPPDSQPLIGPLTSKQVGFVLIGLYTLVICITVWRQANERREFVWAAALYFAVFMLPTQIHERYLYPAAVLALLGAAQAPGLWVIAIGIMFTFSYNIELVAPSRWRFLWPPSIAMYVALLNSFLLVELTTITLRASSPVGDTASRASIGRRFLNGFLIVSRIGAVLIAAILVVTAVSDIVADAPLAVWLGEHVADHSRLVAERLEPTHLVLDWSNSLTWQWELSPKIEEKSVAEWSSTGAQYLLVDGRASAPGEDFSQRVQKLVGQGATLVYQFMNRAVLWTFQPQHVINLTFDDCLTLVGYDVNRDAHNKLSLRLYWYVQRPTEATYVAFVHLIDAATGNMVGQADTALGGYEHPTNNWKPHELVFQTVELPEEILQDLNAPYHIQFGLYQPLNGNIRASIENNNHQSQGDTIEFVIS